MTLRGFQGDVAADGSLMLVGTHDNWARLLSALEREGSVDIAMDPLPATATTHPVTKVALVQADRRDDSELASQSGAGGILDNGHATIFAFDGFAELSDQLRALLEFNDASEIESRGWHAHFDLDPVAEFPTGLQGTRLSEIMLSGPNWR